MKSCPVQFQYHQLQLELCHESQPFSGKAISVEVWQCVLFVKRGDMLTPILTSQGDEGRALHQRFVTFFRKRNEMAFFMSLQ